MLRPVPSWWRLAALAAAVSVAGCAQKSEPPSPPAEGEAAPPPAVSPRPRSNVKVPLPDGWSASIAADQSFRAGPPGHAVLRIDLRPGAATSMPTVKELEAEFRKGVAGVRFQLVEAKSDKDLALITYVLTPASSKDGGIAAEAPGLLGAKRAGKDLFLCATVPGSSDDEVEQAARACAALSVPEP